MGSKTPPLAASGKRIFSGVQPSGGLHLGNYLGALKRFVALQHSSECLYCIVDLHAITVRQEPKTLRNAVRELCAGFIACGLQPDNSIIFNQSAVAGHSELAWVLGCVARFGWLGRMTQFKEKAGKDREQAAVGLFTYPILMAADILAYRATHVPVGEDQKQHLELARDIADKFNHDYAGEIASSRLPPQFLVPPEPVIGGPAARVMSLRDGTKKMSKSDTSSMAVIYLSDDDDAIANKFRKAKTDAHALPSEPAGLAGRPEAVNLLNILAALTDTPIADLLTTYGGGNFQTLKQDLTEAAIGAIAPVRQRMAQYQRDERALDDILARGAQKAEAICSSTVESVREIVGFLPRRR